MLKAWWTCGFWLLSTFCATDSQIDMVPPFSGMSRYNTMPSVDALLQQNHRTKFQHRTNQSSFDICISLSAWWFVSVLISVVFFYLVVDFLTFVWLWTVIQASCEMRSLHFHFTLCYLWIWKCWHPKFDFHDSGRNYWKNWTCTASREQNLSIHRTNTRSKEFNPWHKSTE